MYPFSDFKSNRYWMQHPEEIAHKFYITLCLYISAVSDFAVGLDLKDGNKLNWSVTASYYSIIHSLRMIIFAAAGDYPTGHGEISKLFNGRIDPQLGDKIEISYECSCNWLKRFKPEFDTISGNKAKLTLDELALHYNENLHVSNSYEEFQAIGKILRDAKGLREDSNYEALLISHENRHIKVTEYFNILSKVMLDGADICLKVATKCFMNYIENDKSLREDRDAFKYFVEGYVYARIYSPISNRIKKESILKRIRKNTSLLEKMFSGQEVMPDEAKAIEKFKQLEKLTSFDIFKEKTYLMRTFGGKIESLKENVRSAIVDITKTSRSK